MIFGIRHSAFGSQRRGEKQVQRDGFLPYTLYPTPYTLNLLPYTLNLIPLSIEWTHKRKNSHYISMIR
ncbi:hypothetical protein D1AOALGA4SA_11290 [Olavius algarvensis Delta 1 endosymbiont]|nr:hypothetical protein D1AOALGA4SA_11290 [Olavius algarvensis Delta 1 endosymbiont]